ncbi:MAG TPA: LytR C-terminal domain-containing protein [Acidimicrobiales bacterium]|nr:LytR C-terminal domain-containing protein [Acidimicrobiales bacterium]
MGRRWVPIVIVVVGGLVGLVLTGFPSRAHDTPLTVQAEVSSTSTSVVVAATAAPTTSPPPPARPVGDVRVMVFNASGVAGSATRVGAAIKSQGWDVKAPGADRKTQDATVIMYRTGYDNEARALAVALGLDTGVVAPLDPAVVKADAADLVLVVGTTLARRTP